jgi:threonyl-tRNA synthetase
MADEKDRKTLEERHQMSDLERLRHSCAHVLATAVSRIWPDAQFAAGPPVEGGFYYDVDLKHRISPDDFPQIEAEMKKVVKENSSFERMVVSRDEAMSWQRRADWRRSVSVRSNQSSKSISSMTFRKTKKYRSSKRRFLGPLRRSSRGQDLVIVRPSR